MTMTRILHTGLAIARIGLSFLAKWNITDFVINITAVIECCQEENRHKQ